MVGAFAGALLGAWYGSNTDRIHWWVRWAYHKARGHHGG